VSLRAEVVAVAREMLRLGLVAGTSGNVSARDGDRVHITPSALAYERMEEDDLVTLSPAGDVLAGTREPSSERRVHLAVYAARPDALAEQAAGGAVLAALFAPTGSDEIAAAAVEALAGRRAALLGRHGVLALAESPAAALDVCVAVERQAQIAWLLR
jgi:L-fuculose-phosphate aldolase